MKRYMVFGGDDVCHKRGMFSFLGFADTEGDALALANKHGPEWWWWQIYDTATNFIKYSNLDGWRKFDVETHSPTQS